MQLKPINSAIQSALYGINKGMDGLRQNAAAIANAEQMNGGSPVDLTQPLVEAVMNRLQVQASAKVLGQVETALGSLLDELV